MKDLNFLKKTIKKKEDIILEISDKIWEYAELPYMEYKSCKLLCETLEGEGFIIEKGLAKIPTAFMARYGEGSPVIGILGEYDALDKLSQKAGYTVQSPIEDDLPGHGCGHNALGAGALGAVIGIKEYLMENNLRGTVIYFGCPGEEGAGSKQFMARAGLFDDVDFVYTWHPSTINQVQSLRTVAIMGANFKFKGLSSHAGSAPHLGRSALDAAELMSVGTNYLREHMVDQARVHYAYADAGGISPNVVQDKAMVKYEVRSPKVDEAKELFRRLVNVAKGAALMTETEVEYEITMAFSDYIPNAVLGEIANKAFMEAGPPQWDEADYNLAKKYLNSYNERTKDSINQQIIERYGEGNLKDILDKPLDSIVHPFDKENDKYISGSTDVGDVSYVVPTINFNVATSCIGNVGHSWQMTGQSASVLAHKGLLKAAEIMALAAIYTMKDPESIKEAKKLVLKQNEGSYKCPLPDSVKPPIGRY